MKNYFRGTLLGLCLALGSMACGTVDMKKEPNREALGVMAQFLHQTEDGTWVLIPTSAEDSKVQGNGSGTEQSNKSTTDETGNTAPSDSSEHFLVQGQIMNAQDGNGGYLVEARGIKSCDTGLCPDFDGEPRAAVFLEGPGHFNLFIPKDTRAVFVTVSFQADDASVAPEVLDKYLGVVDKAVGDLNFRF